MAFDRDVDFEDAYPVSTYLDLDSGEVMWVYENDDDAFADGGVPAEDNRTARERVTSYPDRFLEIPGLEHSEHHDLLQEFLYSGWTDDPDQHARAVHAYSGSIGRWKRSVDDDAINSFYEYVERRTLELAEAHLREHGVEPEWI
ncbi:UPF0158 family protein [Botrimarina hoheduenensis]|nr:UPF0158 family protein [Botrimarina hoheduenensis]